MPRVAIIGRNSTSTSSTATAFEAAGFTTTTYREATAAYAELRLKTFSLALLELEIQDTDPFAFCREVSRILPVITTMRGYDVALCVRALECGADDCVASSVGGRELIARAHSVLRRAARSQRSSDLAIAVKEMRVRDGDAIHDLSRGEAEILALLLASSPAPLTALDIAIRLDAKRGTVESRIKGLRRKLGSRLIARGHLGYSVE